MKILLACMRLMIAVGLVSPAYADEIAIINARLYTLGDKGVLDTATLLIKEGRIQKAGPGIKVPDTARIIDAKGMPVTPGAMHAYSFLGLSEITKTTDFNDHSGKGSGLGAHFYIGYGLNYRSAVIADNRRHGLTHAISVPTGGDDLFLGTGAGIMHSGESDSLSGRGPMVVDLAAGGNRNAAWGKLYQVFSEMEAARQKKNSKPGNGLFATDDKAALAAVFEGKQIMMLQVSSAADIRQAIAFKEKYDGVRLVLVGAAEAWLVAQELKKAGVAVLIDPMDTLPDSFGDLYSSARNAAHLHAAGVQFAITPFGAGRNHLAHHVYEAAGYAVRDGLPWEAALEAITLAPARILGLDDLGKLEKGMIANLVIWDGDPLEVTTNPRHVFVRGKERPLISHRTVLRDKYIKKLR